MSGEDSDIHIADSVVQDEKSDYAGFELDSASIAMIAMLLLLNVGVVAAIMSVRSRSKKLDPEAIAASAFERSIFEDSINSSNNPLEQLDTEEITSTPESELPDMQDLMKLLLNYTT